MLDKQIFRERLAPFLSELRNKKQREMLPVYLSGLIAVGERKSMEPIAKRMRVNYDRLHHFISEAEFDDSKLHGIMRGQLLEFLTDKEVYIIWDDTSLPKTGNMSPGVARNYSGQHGKVTNCQTLVTATLSCNGVPFLLDMDLFMPESWVGDTHRLDKARVPEQFRKHQTKPEMAEAMLRRFKDRGVPVGEVLFDTGYCKSPHLRKALDELGCFYTGGINPTHRVYPADLEFCKPEYKGRGARRKKLLPKTAPVSIEDMLAKGTWTKILYRTGTKGPLYAEYAAVRVLLGDGRNAKFGDGSWHRLPGEKAHWLIGQRTPNGEVRTYISNKPADTDLMSLVKRITERWWCEQGHQQMKEELGLDHFEGRTWNGLHRHLLMVMMAFNFLQFLRFDHMARNNEIMPVSPNGSIVHGAALQDAASRNSGEERTAAAADNGRKISKSGQAPVNAPTVQGGARMRNSDRIKDPLSNSDYLEIKKKCPPCPN